MATATRTKALAICCPECQDPTNAVVLKLNDLPTCECECGETFSPAEAAARFAELARKWQRVAAWVEQAPDLG